MKNQLVYILILFVVVFSCTDEISVDVSEISPILVVEGRITSKDEPVQVRLSQTTSPYSDADNEGINSAVIVIENDLNQRDSLKHTQKGVFVAKNYRGEVGRTYTLTIYYQNQIYQVVDNMNPVAPIDSLVIDKDIFDDEYLSVFVYMQEPNEKGNNYKWQTYINEKLMTNNVYADDQYVNGNYIKKFQVYSTDEKEEGEIPESEIVKLGDQIVVDQLSLSDPVLQFFKEKQNQDRSQGSFFSSPASNITGNVMKINSKGDVIGKALGCFYAAAISSDTLIVKTKLRDN